MKITKRDILYWCIILLLIFVNITAITKCSNNDDKYTNNIEALNDSIHHIKKNGKEIVYKKIFVTNNQKELKNVNKELYNKIKEAGVKNASNATYFNGDVDFGTHDTVYVVKSIEKKENNINRNFDFSNKYRILSGNLYYRQDSLGLNVLKDKVNFDYTIVQDKNNKVYIKSDNPYVNYKSINSFTIKQRKQKHWNIGPQIGIGYDFVNQKIVPQIGIGITYGIINF